MNDTENFGRLKLALDKETGLVKAVQESPAGIALKGVREEMLVFLKSVTKGDDIGLILAIERRFLANDLVRNLDDEEIVTDLKAALSELDGAEECLAWVHNPDKYKDVDTSHGPKSRKGQVPNDAIRRLFTSRLADLNNMAKTPMSDEEMKIVLERRRMIRRAEKLYAIQQHRVLGLEAPGQGMGRE